MDAPRLIEHRLTSTGRRLASTLPLYASGVRHARRLASVRFTPARAMNPELGLLTATAASLAFVHTLLGPDHYLPFVGMGAASRWSLRKVWGVTLVCGLGHIVGSIALGFVGIALQAQVARLELIEGARGDIAAWALLSFGLLYALWGVHRAWRGRPHTHWHFHGGRLHRHQHDHRERHAHGGGASSRGSVMTPWFVFVIFVLGPCEPLIPLLMYPAAKESLLGLVLVVAVFGVVTVVTMLAAVTIAFLAVRRVRVPSLSRYGHALAGSCIALCGAGVLFLGL